VAPHISEKIYQNLSASSNSLFLDSLPLADNKLINQRLEADMALTQELITATLACREKAGLSIRWPVSKVIITRKSLPVGFEELFLNYVNAKVVVNAGSVPEGVKIEFKPNFANIKESFGDNTAGRIIPKLLTMSKESINKHLAESGFIKLNLDGGELIVTDNNFLRNETLPEGLVSHANVYLTTKLDESLLAEGYCRELIRRVQEARKSMSLKKNTWVETSIKAPKALEQLLEPQLKDIKTVTGSKSIDFKPSGKYDVSTKYKLRDYDIVVNVRK
jgi:isoleucyl-tRNA synthetase